MPVKFLRGFLWFTFVFSFSMTFGWIFFRDYNRSGVRSVESAEMKFIRDMGEELNQWYGFPTCTILSAGFLLASYSVDGVRAAVEAGRSTPEERRAEIRDALVSAAERRREPAVTPQAERTTGQPAPR
jgi:hypothetical protein